MVIEDLQTAYAKAGAPSVEVHFDCVVRHSNYPEHLVRIDMHVVVMDLLRETLRSDRTGVQVKSDKGERALMASPIRTDELALIEAHVCSIREPDRDTRDSVCSRPTA